MDKNLSEKVFAACRATDAIRFQDYKAGKITYSTNEATCRITGAIDNFFDNDEPEEFKNFFAQTDTWHLKKLIQEDLDDVEDCEDLLEKHFSIGHNSRYYDIESFLRDVDWQYVYKMTVGMEWEGKSIEKKKKPTIAVSEKTAKEEILDTYDLETLREIYNLGAYSGLAKSHLDLEVNVAFYDKYTIEIRTFILDKLGADMIDELHENAEDEDHFKQSSVWSFIELIAYEATKEED